MKIAIVHTSADSTRGGAETSIVEMAAALAALGEDVTIVTRGGPLNDSQSRADAHRQLPNSVTLPGSGFTKAAQIRSFLAEAAQYCREQGFDIVHAVVPLRGCHVYQPRGGTYAATQAANVEIQKSGLAKGAKRLFQQLNRKQSLLHRLELEMLR